MSEKQEMIATLHRSLCEFDSLFVDVIDCIDTIYAMSVLLKENLTEPDCHRLDRVLSNVDKVSAAGLAGGEVVGETFVRMNWQDRDLQQQTEGATHA